jgi:hypothetical protein
VDRPRDTSAIYRSLNRAFDRLSPGPRSAKLLPPRPYNPARLALECLVRHVDPLVHPRRLEQRLELLLRSRERRSMLGVQPASGV